MNPLCVDGARALRELAEEAARIGGALARRYFRTDFAVTLKADRSEVSAADHAAQAAIIAYLRSRRPDDAFVTEETQAHTGSAAPPPPANDRVCWIIDPIDGTRNFCRGLPFYACSVAAMFQGYPVAGAIFDPLRNLLYSAGGDPAPALLFINGAPARPRPMAAIDGVKLNLVVGIPSQPEPAVAAVVHDWLTRYV
ncbi:MAG: inositol monophosphatase family protein, partial [Planctomycetota bacterium]